MASVTLYPYHMVIQDFPEGWTQFHGISTETWEGKETGKINRYRAGEFKRFNEGGPGSEMSDSAATFGLAAGKIYILKQDHEGTCRKDWLSMSGFWLEGGYFITCARFNDTNVKSDTEVLKREHEKPLVYISNLRDSTAELMDPSLYEYDRSAVLVDVDVDADIAIYHAQARRDKHHDNFASLGQLHSLSAPMPPQRKAWCVAYLDSDEQLQEEERKNATRHECCDEEKNILNNPSCEGFDLVTHWALEAIGKHRGMDLFHLIKEKQYRTPDYDEVYIYDQRALAVGFVSDIPHDGQKKDPEAYSTLAHHTFTGYFGCQGGMICAFDDGKPKVIGLFPGQLDSLSYTQFTKFTQRGVDWITRTVKERTLPAPYGSK